MRTITSIIVLCLIMSCTNKNIKTLHVADHTLDCIGVAPQKCLLIKENEGDDWQNFYDQIEGFNYQQGYSYKILVEVSTIENPPADASNIKYSLIEIIDKEESPSVKLGNNDWEVIALQDKKNFTQTPWLSFNIIESKVNGNSGCNNFFGNTTIKKNTIKFGNLGSTRMKCADMSAEDLFLSLLPKVTRFSFEDNKLQLRSEENEVLILLQSK